MLVVEVCYTCRVLQLNCPSFVDTHACGTRVWWNACQALVGLSLKCYTHAKTWCIYSIHVHPCIEEHRVLSSQGFVLILHESTHLDCFAVIDFSKLDTDWHSNSRSLEDLTTKGDSYIDTSYQER